MKLSKGVVAKVTFYETLLYNKYSCYYDDTRYIYEDLNDRFGTEECIEAASWCELATVGEWYEGCGFEIEIMEE